MNFNDKIPVEPHKCLCIHALDGYETYMMDKNTIGVRPIWFDVTYKLPALKGLPFLVTDGTVVGVAELDEKNNWVRAGSFIEGKYLPYNMQITHWMNFPDPPK